MKPGAYLLGNADIPANAGRHDVAFRAGRRELVTVHDPVQ
jgi:hypothetical protein